MPLGGPWGFRDPLGACPSTLAGGDGDGGVEGERVLVGHPQRGPLTRLHLPAGGGGGNLGRLALGAAGRAAPRRRRESAPAGAPSPPGSAALRSPLGRRVGAAAGRARPRLPAVRGPRAESGGPRRRHLRHRVSAAGGGGRGANGGSGGGGAAGGGVPLPCGRWLAAWRGGAVRVPGGDTPQERRRRSRAGGARRGVREGPPAPRLQPGAFPADRAPAKRSVQVRCASLPAEDPERPRPLQRGTQPFEQHHPRSGRGTGRSRGRGRLAQVLWERRDEVYRKGGCWGRAVRCPTCPR